MTDQELEQLRYPVGRYQPQPFSEQLLNDWLIDIRFLPNHLEQAILNLDEAQLNTPYRPGGWNLRQVVHHVADSHMNALSRFKLCLTEDKPTIKPYDENKWVLLPDAELLPVNISITQLFTLHEKIGILLSHVQPADWNRTVIHPEHNREMSLWFLAGLYAWHGRHHTAHITSLRERMGW